MLTTVDNDIQNKKYFFNQIKFKYSSCFILFYKKSANYHKFRYYSAHDSTLNAVLVALDHINDENHSWPPFAADITIELWKRVDENNKKNYYIKLLYCDEVRIEKKN